MRQVEEGEHGQAGEEQRHLPQLHGGRMLGEVIGRSRRHEYAPAAEAPGVQRAVLREEEGVVGPQRDQRDRQRQLASADQEVN